MFSPRELIQLNRTVGGPGQVLGGDIAILQGASSSFQYYETPLEQFAAVARFVMQNHPFVDGNKRTGVVILLAGIEHLGLSIDKSDDDWVYFAVNCVVHKWSVEQIVRWLTT